MQKIKLRNLQHLHRQKIVLTLASFLLVYTSFSQEKTINLPNHDQKPYYFGIVLGYNSSHYNVTHHPDFLAYDTVMSVESQNSGRIHLGIMANWQISNRFDLRFYPLHLIFSEKKFRYTQSIPNQGDNQLEYIKKVESIVMSFPLQVRLKSDRINNFRVYSLLGVKYDFDLASNAGARNAEEIVKVKKSDFGVNGPAMLSKALGDDVTIHITVEAGQKV